MKYLVALAFLFVNLSGCGDDGADGQPPEEPIVPLLEIAQIPDGGGHADNLQSPFLVVLGALEKSSTAGFSVTGESSRLTTVNPTPKLLDLYGNEPGNDEFQTYSKSVVAKAVNHIRRLVSHFGSKKKPISKGFRKHLEDLGNSRHEIAVKTGTSSPHEFGLSRTPLWAPHLITPVAPEVYPRLHENAVAVLKSELERLHKGGVTPSAWKEDRNEDSRVRTVLLPYDKYFPGADAYTTIQSRYLSGDREYEERWIEGRMFLHLCGVEQPLSATKQELVDLVRRASEQGMKMAKVEIEIKVDGEYVPFFNFRSGIFSNPKKGDDALRSRIRIQHPRTDQVASLVSKSGQLWQEAIEWKGTEPRELMQRIAKLHYVLDNTVPFARGSAAITEWVTEGLYRYHGYVPSLRGELVHSIVQEAMGTASLSEFVAKYLEFVTVRKMDEVPRQLPEPSLEK